MVRSIRINHQRWMKERKVSMVPRKQIVACVIRQYGTGLFRTCVSMDKNNTICLSTHPDEPSATETINRFLETYQQGRIKTLEDVLAFVDSLRAKDQVNTLTLINENGIELAA
jgi:hypothetical protein